MNNALLCFHCKQNAYPLDLLYGSVCIEKDRLTEIASCVRYNRKTDNSLECLKCNNANLRSGTECNSSCPDTKGVLNMEVVFGDVATDADNNVDHFYVFRNNVCTDAITNCAELSLDIYTTVVVSTVT